VPVEEKQLQHALGLAYRYLNRRERTASELRRHLERNGIDAAGCGRALEVLTEEGTIDDARFARLFVQDKRELAEWGRERIRQGLLARGVARELAEDALDADAARGRDGTSEPGIDPHQAELERAVGVLSRRFPARPRERRDRDRALALLIRKGYDHEVALDALTAYARAG
jgi:regulatory protein